jgi:hypothetical protein
MKKAPANTPTKAPDQGHSNTITTKAGRRGASSLWSAIRALNGAQITLDDARIISEALADLQLVLLLAVAL